MPRYKRPVAIEPAVPGVEEPRPPEPETVQGTITTEEPKRRGRPPKVKMPEFSPAMIAQMGKSLGVGFAVIFNRMFPENPLNQEEQQACGEGLDLWFQCRLPWFLPYAPELALAATVGGVILIRASDRIAVKRGGTPSYLMKREEAPSTPPNPAPNGNGADGKPLPPTSGI